MDIKNIISTGLVSVGLHKCEGGHFKIAQVVTIYDEDGLASGHETVKCDCGKNMTCKTQYELEFSYEETSS